MPVVRTHGGRSVYGHMITKFSWMGRFTYPLCSSERELRYNVIRSVFSGQFFRLNLFPGVSFHCISKEIRFDEFFGHFSRVVFQS